MAYLESIIQFKIKMNEWYITLNRSAVSKELSVNKFNTSLDTQGRLAPMATKFISSNKL